MNSEQVIYAFSDIDIDLINCYDVTAPRKVKSRLNFRLNKKVLRFAAVAACIAIICLVAGSVVNYISTIRTSESMSQAYSLIDISFIEKDAKLFSDYDEFVSLTEQEHILNNYTHNGYEAIQQGFVEFDGSIENSVKQNKKYKFLYCYLYNSELKSKFLFFSKYNSDGVSLESFDGIFKDHCKCDEIKAINIGDLNGICGSSLEANRTICVFQKDGYFYCGMMNNVNDLDLMYDWLEETLK